MYSKNRFYSLLQELFGLFLTRQRFTEIPVLTAWVRSCRPKATELPGRSGSVLSECKIKQVSVSKLCPGTSCAPGPAPPAVKHRVTGEPLSPPVYDLKAKP